MLYLMLEWRREEISSIVVVFVYLLQRFYTLKKELIYFYIYNSHSTDRFPLLVSTMKPMKIVNQRQ